MIKINDVIVPTKGTGKYLSVRALMFDITPTNGISLYWAIHVEDIATEDEVEIKKPGAMVLEGNLNLPQEMYDTWGTDDAHVTDWVMSELGITAAS